MTIQINFEGDYLFSCDDINVKAEAKDETEELAIKFEDDSFYSFVYDINVKAEAKDETEEIAIKYEDDYLFSCDVEMEALKATDETEEITIKYEDDYLFSCDVEMEVLKDDYLLPYHPETQKQKTKDEVKAIRAKAAEIKLIERTRAKHIKAEAKHIKIEAKKAVEKAKAKAKAAKKASRAIKITNPVYTEHLNLLENPYISLKFAIVDICSIAAEFGSPFFKFEDDLERLICNIESIIRVLSTTEYDMFPTYVNLEQQHMYCITLLKNTKETLSMETSHDALYHSNQLYQLSHKMYDCMKSSV
jgi:hypothetical protein